MYEALLIEAVLQRMAFTYFTNRRLHLEFQKLKMRVQFAPVNSEFKNAGAVL
jgi:hypothetical protein